MGLDQLFVNNNCYVPDVSAADHSKRPASSPKSLRGVVPWQERADLVDALMGKFAFEKNKERKEALAIFIVRSLSHPSAIDFLKSECGWRPGDIAALERTHTGSGARRALFQSYDQLYRDGLVNESAFFRLRSLLMENRSEVDFFIEQFDREPDPLRREYLASLILNVCSYPPAIEFLQHERGWRVEDIPDPVRSPDLDEETWERILIP